MEMNGEHEGAKIYVAIAPCLFAGRQCYPGAAVMATDHPGPTWEPYDPARHGPDSVVLCEATVAGSCQCCGRVAR